MNNDLISRSELLGKFTAMLTFSSDRVVLIENVIKQIQNAPTVEKPIRAIAKTDKNGDIKIELLRPQGEWGKWVISEIRCPKCLEYFQTDCYSMEELNKCPSCGADMQKVGGES